MIVKVTDESWISRDVIVAFMIETFIIIIATLTISPNTIVVDDWIAFKYIDTTITYVCVCGAILGNYVVINIWRGEAIDAIALIS